MYWQSLLSTYIYFLNKKIMKKISYLIMIISACLAVGCHNHDHDHDHDEHLHEEEAHSEEQHAHAGEIIFTKAQAEAAGVKIEKASPSTFRSVIKTSGEIQSLQGDEHTVVATTSGIVKYINPSITEGSHVAAGSAIVSVSAEKMYDGDPVKKAKLAYETAEKEFRRAERLVKDNIISQKEYELIKMNYETARESYIGQASNITASGVLVKSPISGYIKNRIVANGEYVSAGQPIAVVSSNRRLQLRADVSERFYSKLSSITTANFITSYDDAVYSLDSLNGRLISYGRTSTGGAAYIPVTFEFDNIGTIVPGSFVEVYLLTGIRENVMSLPAAAITEEQGLFFVYVQEHEEAYVKKEVTLGDNDGTRVEIKKGLKTGDKVVVRGAYQVKMASAKAEIPGHTH